MDRVRRAPAWASGLVLCAFGCGGVSTRHVAGSGSDTGTNVPEAELPPDAVLVAQGDLHLLAAKKDASLIAYADNDHVVWAVRPGETPERVIEFYDDEISATFARDADALVLRGNLVEPYLVYWTPEDGHWLMGPTGYMGSISYGGAVLYGAAGGEEVVLWRPHLLPQAIGTSANWPLIQANASYGVVATKYGLYGVELGSYPAPQELIAPPGVTRVALADDGPLVAFLGEPTPPADGSATPPCCALHVYDLAAHRTLYEEPASVEFFQAGGGAVFFYGGAGQSDLRRIFLDGTPSVHFGTGPVVEWFGASADANRVIVRDEPFGDYSIPVSVQELGGNRVLGQSILRAAPVYFRHGAEVLVSGVGTPNGPPFSVALTGAGTDTSDAFPGLSVFSTAALRDDEDGILFESPEADESPSALRIGNVMTLEHALVARGSRNALQVSGRRVVAEVRNGATEGIYVLTVPTP